MKKSISVVIPNYNGKELLEKNLPFLFEALAISETSFEIIIADDCSTDNSIVFLKATYPAILLVENKQNKGFSGNINSGIAVATKELVFLLNSDIELTPNYFLPLFNYFQNPKTFGVMGRIISMDSKEIQDGAKYPQYSSGNLTTTINYLPEEIKNDIYIYSLFLSGANALVDRKKLLEIGCFQELFNPFYWEDVELSIKAWKLNYTCYYEHNSICKHPLSATIGKYNKKKKVSIIARKNKLLFHYLHLNGSVLFLWMSIYISKMIVRSFTFNFSYFNSFLLFYNQLSLARIAKKAFQKTVVQNGIRDLELRDISETIKKHIGLMKINKF